VSEATPRTWDVVVVTRDRVRSLLGTVARLRSLPQRPGVIVVDNGSTDGTAAAVGDRFPDVTVLQLGRNVGAAGRNLGVAAATAPYVAFSDDDSWWSEDALSIAASRFDRHPSLGAVAARILVGQEERLDDTSALMARSPLPADGLPGPQVLGFVACGTAVRRSAFLQTRGFHPRYGMGSEERLVAMDLATAGWKIAYVEDVVAHHHPEGGARPGRRRAALRNDLWTAWLRRPVASAARRTIEMCLGGRPRWDAWRAVAQAMAGLPWVLRERQRVPAPVERMARLVDATA
jgi:N-acetylglucosaminyl-diphospho-decaprenol L-rhamnosyltransferase